MHYKKISNPDFFTQDVLELAPALIGKFIAIRKDQSFIRYRITETEAYRGEEDMACHARKGRTRRTDPMYQTGGILYIYLIYGMYWMMNIVAGKKENPQAVLIRGIQNYDGPGKLSREVGIDKTFNYENLLKSERIHLESDNEKFNFQTGKRIGIDYAEEYWRDINWRYIIDSKSDNSN